MATSREMGPFEVLERLGAGGMGEVFKARDKRLNRFVAIKFLPAEAGEAARERFQREALAIAALNHPHICTLHEIGEDGGRPYLVLELLEGETLKARLRRGALEPDLLLDWSVQISDALDAAHRKGVLHRDLKPDNIWVGAGGHVKVLDFGLARLEGEASGNDATVLTSPGVAMGTYPYMSPEQAKGQPLDARSDVFSFGSVFYEMASGRQAFAGPSAAEVTAAILREEPKKLSAVRPDLPAKFEEVAGRCLEKDPDLRYQSAADLRGDLKRLKRESGSATSIGMAVAAGSRRRGWLWPTMAAVVVIAAGAGLWMRWRNSGIAPLVPLKFRQLTFSGNVVDAVISPDGKFIAHVDDGPQGTSLRLMVVANGGDTQVVPAGPGCCSSPSFSPDGSTLSYVQNRRLEMIPVLGGAAQTIADPSCSGAGFSPDGKNIAYVVPAGNNTLMVAHADGTGARPLHDAAAGSGYTSQCYGRIGNASHSPAWSPDGKWIALPRAEQSQVGHVELVDAQDGHAVDIGPNIWFAFNLNWMPKGRDLIFSGSIPGGAVSQVWRMQYPSGQLTTLTSDLQGYDSASLSASGDLAVVHSAAQASLWVQLRPAGDFQQLAGGGADMDGALGLAWTPQGGLVSVRKYGAERQLWAVGADGSAGRRIGTGLTINLVSDLHVALNGDILFGSFDGTNSVAAMSSDGGSVRPLVHPGPGDQALFPTPIGDGQTVAYLYDTNTNSQTLWAVPLQGGTPRQLWDGFVYVDGNPASPDGTRIFAITQGRSDAHIPVVVRVDGGKPQVTPIALDFKTMRPPYGWTADGKAITYLDQHGTVDNIWAFPLAGGKPYALTHFTNLNIFAYAMGRDGRLAISRGSGDGDIAVTSALVGH